MHARLRQDILRLNRLLTAVIREQAGDELLHLITRLQRLARKRRAGDATAEGRLRRLLARLDLETARSVAHALTVFFDIRNLAEDRHRVRVLRERDAAGDSAESVRGAVRRLETAGVRGSAARELATRRKIGLVLTAHPTEAKRRSVRRKLARLRQALDGLDQGTLFERERRELEEDARAALTGLWQIDLVRVGQPTVQAEVERGLFFASTLWRTVPMLHRELQEALPDGDAHLPEPITFGSWIGGDRDGHPLVTVEVTEWTLRRHRERVLGFHVATAEEAAARLTMSSRLTRIPPGVHLAVKDLLARYPEAAEIAHQISSREPYRRYLAVVRWRLERTLGAGLDPAPGGYTSVEELLDDIRAIDGGLRAARGAAMADTMTGPWIRQARAFGFWLAPLDIRQEAGVFVRVVADVCRHRGLATDYTALDEPSRLEVLGRPAPAVEPEEMEDALCRDTLRLFRLIRKVAGQDRGRALGHFIISMTHHSSDVLAVLWLAQVAGMSTAELAVLRIVPLFETIDALARAAAITEELLANATYRAQLAAQDNLQVVMIGYSDSTKDGGYVAANWGLYRAQEEIVETAGRYEARIRFFHGRGGSLGRGGGPAARGILSLPHRAMEEGLCITEQGEVLAERYDDAHIAHRHLEQLLWASLVSAAEAPLELDPEWRVVMEQLSEHAYRVYRELVELPGFLTYFHEATPVDEIERLPIGSRPARREGRRTLQHLRAIPWVFAWIQSRHFLPAWYGLGTAIAVVAETYGGAEEELRRMWRLWPFFTALIDNAALALARTDLAMARAYADLVTDDTARERLWGLITEEHDLARRWILRITGRKGLIDDVPWLEEAIRTRNPTVDVLNYLQIELLRRLRAGGENAGDVSDLVRLTIQGVSSGMRTTG